MKKLRLYVTILVAAIPIVISSKALAIPAWGRKYGTACSSCHRPNVPRLNPEGHRFRKWGFRYADEFGKTPEYKEIGQYLSVRGRVRYNYTDPENAATVSRFDLNDATLFYAGPVTPNLTAFFEAEWADTNDIEVNGYMSWTDGSADNYWQVRTGQFHTLTRVGWAGFDRPSGISTTKVLGTQLTTTSVPFTISKDQRGLELSLGGRDGRVIAQVLNGLNYTGDGNKGDDPDTDKDVLLAYEQMLTDKGSGFTLMAYRGVWHADPTGAGLRNDPDFNEFTFYRYGGTFSLFMDIFPAGLSEIQGGAIFSYDLVPSRHPTFSRDVKGQAYFVGIEQYFKDASVFIRADFINLDTQNSNWETTYVLGAAHMVNDYLRLSGEVFYTDNKRVTGVDEPGVALEAMLNF
ncbi:MAG: hypothetical protein HZA78_10805 [Candidatus Schekmanbacteria bacterium]|nr:hypothetical protein [Candidatus Schekmanbacteria bacterium]